MQVFKCTICDVFFEDYGKSTVHLGLEHSQTLVSSIVGSKTTACCRSAVCNGVSSLIVPVKLPNVYVVLRRKVAERFLEGRKETSSSSTSGSKSQRRQSNKPQPGVRNGKAPVEIKLDNMTASEIEGLIGDLVNKPSRSKCNSKTDNAMQIKKSTPRRSVRSASIRVPIKTSPAPNPSRPAATKTATSTKTTNKKSATEIKLDSLKASEIELLMNGLFRSKSKSSSNKITPKAKADLSHRAVNNYSRVEANNIEVQNEETSNSRRSARRRKPVVRLVELDNEDNAEIDLGEVQDSDQEDDEYVPETEPKIKKRSAASKSPVKSRSRSSSSDDDQLDSYYEPNDEDIPRLDRYDNSNNPESMISRIESSKSLEDSDEDMPPVLQPYDDCNTHKENNFPKLQPYVRDRRNDKAKPVYKLQCRYCPAQFSAKTWFGNHMREKHANSNGLFTCNICPTGKEYTLRFLHKHYRRYHNLKDAEEQKNWEYTCKICGKKNQTLFAHESHERYHRRFMNPDNPFPCPVCPHRFSTKFNLTQHFNIHLENNPFTCTFPGCGKKFAGNYHLKRHYSYHIYRTIYKCNQCEATYTRPHRLENHISRFHSTAYADPKSKARQPVRRRKYAIKSLNMGFGTMLDVVKNSSEQGRQLSVTSVASTSVVKVKTESGHAEEDESAEGTPQIQGTFSLDMNSLPRHSNKVVSSDPVFLKLTKENPDLIKHLLPKAYAGSGALFECDLCGWKGSRAHFLQQHLQKEHNKKMEPVTTPSDINPLGISLICGTCGFQASTSEAIAKHMKSAHPEMNKVQCSYCNLRFKTDKLKGEHETKCHLSTSKFSCEKCPASFVTDRGYQNHMQTKHINPSAKFTCKTCGNTYHSKTSYYKHMDSHLPSNKRRFYSNKPAKCKLCHQVLATKATLRRHIQYVHLKARNKYNEAVQERRKQRKAELLQSKSSTGTGFLSSSGSDVNSAEKDNSASAGTSNETMEKNTSQDTVDDQQEEIVEENEMILGC